MSRPTTPFSPLIISNDSAESWAKHMVEDPSSSTWFSHSKHFFVYTIAGKPAFSRYGSDVELAPFMATLIAITSVVNDNKDELNYLRSKDHLFVFMSKGPLQFCCASKTGENVFIIQRQLEFLFHAMCSIVPFPTIQSIFDKSYGTDFRNIIGGTYNQLKSAITHANTSAGVVHNAYDIYQFAPSERAVMTEALQKAVSSTNIELFKSNNDCILFAGVLKEGKIVCLGKRSAQLTPMDSQVLIAFVNSISARGTISWMPLCLSDFNEKAQIHVFVNYLTEDSAIVFCATQPTSLPHLTRCCESFERAIKATKAFSQIENPSQTICPFLSKREILHFIVFGKTDNQVSASSYTVHTTRKEQKKLFRVYETLYVATAVEGFKQEMICDENVVVVSVENNTHFAFVSFPKMVDKNKINKISTNVLSWAVKEDSLWVKKFAQFS
ncbi:protein SAND, putative [Entamoeba invadens IP1]|uniref:Protein SAND, putative n=1 Tax=Entamoeba invadens IP1 TaxID=370355 RepID=A0A0A1U4Q8_ENTIV|nr:protein SAND, putative [Entamoeba invadens IP1]ELP89237.1 protein SAND, putative [Entamoeba invadens IP1]|eukprot:XP_004256008.1 protein SAND, putative [Entamoeba invadens IP1]